MLLCALSPLGLLNFGVSIPPFSQCSQQSCMPLGAILLRHVSSILKCSERGKRCPEIHLPWLSHLSASTRLVLSAFSRPARSLCENLRTPCMCAIAVSARTRGLSPLSACTWPALSLRVAFRPLWRWEGGDSPAICGEKIEVQFACL